VVENLLALRERLQPKVALPKSGVSSAPSSKVAAMLRARRSAAAGDKPGACATGDKPVASAETGDKSVSGREELGYQSEFVQQIIEKSRSRQITISEALELPRSM